LRSAGERSQASSPFEAPQLVLAKIGEFDSRSGQEIAEGSRYDHLTGLGDGQDAGRRVDRDATDTVRPMAASPSSTR
jgi:hypothetical protein